MNQRMRTVELYNLDILEVEPFMEPVDVVPKRMVGFNYAKSRDVSDACIHFFIDDYQFERIWNFPTRYGYIRKAQCVCSPDFSLYLDMPDEMKRYNVWRSAAMGAWWQQQGLVVVPTLQWSDESSYEYCFKYIPKNSTVALSAKGTQNSPIRKKFFAEGLKVALDICKPKRVLLLGKADCDFGSVEVIKYKDEQIARFRNVKKTK